MRLIQHLLRMSLAFVVCLASYDLVQADDGGNTCRATGATASDKHGWDLDCEGKCPLGEEGRPDCDESSGSDNKGTYSACSCDDDGGLNNTCCVLVLRPVKGDSDDGNSNGGHTKYRLGTKGDCPSCPASGACQVVTGHADGAQAACR